MVHAFEQSSYFIVDLVDSPQENAVNGRLAVPASSLKTAKDTHTPQAEAQEGEFEINFNQSIRPSDSNNSSFQFNTTTDNSTRVSDSSFDGGTFDLIDR
jgi:hypothetical protein